MIKKWFLFWLVLSALMLAMVPSSKAQNSFVELQSSGTVLFQSQVATGRIRDAHTVIKFAEKLDIGTTQETIWDGSIEYPWNYSNTPYLVDVVSASASDVDQGAGAWSVRVAGLDENGMDYAETVLLNGITPVTTTGQFIRVFRAFIVQSNVPLGAVGDITVTRNDNSDIQAEIHVDNNQTLMAVYSVPYDHWAFVYGWAISVGATKSADLRAWVRDGTDPNSPWRMVKTQVLQGTSETQNFAVPYTLPPGTDMRVTAAIDVGSGDVDVEWSMILLNESHVNADYLNSL